MASNLTLYDNAGNPVVVSGEDMKGFISSQNRTWSNLVGLRSLNTIYTNNTDSIIQVQVSSVKTEATQCSLDLYVNNVIICRSYGRYGEYGVSADIPIGATYKVTSNYAIQIWTELR